MTELEKELNRIQKELISPKNQYNSFGKYKYRSCEDILEGIKKTGTNCLILLSDKIELIGERYYIKATATIKGYNSEISVEAYAREPENKKGMDSAQITGSTSSYARKYALNGLFCIDDTKDADHNNKGENEPIYEPKSTSKQNTQNKTTKEKELEKLYKIVKEKNINGSDIKDIMIEMFKKDNSKKLSINEIKELIKRIDTNDIENPFK